MSVIQLGAQQIAAYITAIADDPASHQLDDASTFSGTLEIAMGNTNQLGDARYIQGRDRIYSLALVNSSGDPQTGIMKLDPEFTLLNVPADVDFQVEASYAPRFMIAGQWNQQTGQQGLYNTPATATAPRVVNLDTLSTPAGAAFTGPNGDFIISASDIATGVEGGWNQLRNGGMFFEGLTDGISGETLATGANVYPQGLYLAAVNTGTLSSDTMSFFWGWIDIETRRLVGRLGGNIGALADKFPIRTTTVVPSFPANPQSEAPIGGDEFSWDAVEFVADEDSTFAQPKGRIFFHIEEWRPVTGSPAPGDPDYRVYVRFTDFNPFNIVAAPGEPERVHGRIRLTTRILADRNPQFGLAGQSSHNTGSTVTGLVFDPNRSRFVWSMRDGTVTGFDGSPYGVVTNTTLGFFSTQVDPVIVTAPAARDVPRTNDITRFLTTVSGDLAEPVGGQVVEFELVRSSTEGEVLDASTFPGTSTVANPPIDDTLPGDPSGTLSIISDGVPLAEGVDYTVVLSTGVITWITDQSGASIVLATYEHRDTEATPPHGTLLSASAQSDVFGQAPTAVQYADNDALVGTLDKLKSAFP